MAESHENKAPEIVPLNDGWGDFDLERVSVEALEQRFELSLALPPAALADCKGPVQRLPARDVLRLQQQLSRGKLSPLRGVRRTLRAPRPFLRGPT